MHYIITYTFLYRITVFSKQKNLVRGVALFYFFFFFKSLMCNLIEDSGFLHLLLHLICSDVMQSLENSTSHSCTIESEKGTYRLDIIMKIVLMPQSLRWNLSASQWFPDNTLKNAILRQQKIHSLISFYTGDGRIFRQGNSVSFLFTDLQVTASLICISKT